MVILIPLVVIVLLLTALALVKRLPGTEQIVFIKKSLRKGIAACFWGSSWFAVFWMTHSSVNARKGYAPPTQFIVLEWICGVAVSVSLASALVYLRNALLLSTQKKA